MLKRGLIKDKRAQSDEPYGTAIFFILTLSFFLILFIWVWSSSDSSFVYEQAHAKEIALIIDKASPGMSFNLNFEKALEKAEKKEIDFQEIVQIDNEKNIVNVRLSERGFSYSYFSDYEVEWSIDKEKKILKLEIEDA